MGREWVICFSLDEMVPIWLTWLHFVPFCRPIHVKPHWYAIGAARADSRTQIEMILLTERKLIHQHSGEESIYLSQIKWDGKCDGRCEKCQMGCSTAPLCIEVCGKRQGGGEEIPMKSTIPSVIWNKDNGYNVSSAFDTDTHNRWVFLWHQWQPKNAMCKHIQLHLVTIQSTLFPHNIPMLMTLSFLFKRWCWFGMRRWRRRRRRRRSISIYAWCVVNFRYKCSSSPPPPAPAVGIQYNLKCMTWHSNANRHIALHTGYV